MVELLNLFTFYWLALWAIFGMWKLATVKRNTIPFLIIIHFLFCGVPLLLDISWGKPTYEQFPGLQLATRDDIVALVYCCYVSAVPVFWWFIGRVDYNPHVKVETFKLLKHLKIILYMAIIAPLLACLLAPDPQVYLNYAWMVRIQVPISADTIDYYNIITMLSIGSILAAVALLATAEHIHLAYIIFLLFWLSTAIWLNGKRAIFAIAVVLIWYTLWKKGCFKNIAFFISVLFLSLIVFSFSYLYQTSLRDISTLGGDSQEFYNNFRIDYGRDHTIKMAIFAELYPEKMQILDYRGASLLFDLVMYVPRNLWPEKPYPYATYFTSAMLFIPTKFLGWGITTSWLDEAIANFGWLGLIIGPLIPALICRLGDASGSALGFTLSILAGALLLTVSFPAFAEVFFLWILIIIYNKFIKKQNLPKRYKRHGAIYLER